MRSRLLIVDDNRHFLEAAKDLLERQGAEVVGVCSTGADAARLAAELRPDVVLVDVDLGPEDGLDVAARFGGSPPVLLISAYSEAEIADLLACSTAVGFISKTDLSADRIVALLDHTGT
ncbi:MAG: putative response regulator [Actinomycetia bacterium]|nr:putative response regulator [Actinomycetes bacterium]